MTLDEIAANLAKLNEELEGTKQGAILGALVVAVMVAVAFWIGGGMR